MALSIELQNTFSTLFTGSRMCTSKVKNNFMKTQERAEFVHIEACELIRMNMVKYMLKVNLKIFTN